MLAHVMTGQIDMFGHVMTGQIAEAGCMPDKTETLVQHSSMRNVCTIN